MRSLQQLARSGYFRVSDFLLAGGNPLVGRDFNTKSFVKCHDYN